MSKQPIKSIPPEELRKLLGGRLQEVMNELGVSIGELAEILGMKYERIRTYVNGRVEPSLSFYQLFSDTYPTVDMGYILTGRKHDPFPPKDSDINVREIFVVDFVPASGFAKGIPKERIINETYTTDLHTPGVFGLPVYGSEYLPDFKDGDVLIVAPVSEFENGKLHVYYTKEAGVYELALVHKTGEDSYRAIPVHPGRQPLTLTKKEVRFMGRVIEIDRKFK